VDAPSWGAGRPIRLTLRNQSDNIAHGNRCSAGLEPEADRGWAPVLSVGAAECTPVAAPIPPRGEATQHMTLPAELEAGR
jgi:hypothetical protein